jgi:hypothetical protein
MTPIEVPFATLQIKLIMGPACLLLVGVVLRWGIPAFMVFLRVLTGREPRQPGTRTIHLALGLLIFAVIFGLAVIPGAIFVEMMTTPPSVVSDAGIASGGGFLLARKTIAWDEVQRVDCLLQRRSHSVQRLRVIAGTKRIELAGGIDLTGVRDVLWAHVPREAIRPCSVYPRQRY